MICLELNWLFYDPSWMLQLSEFVWALRSSVWIFFNNFLLIDATDKSKISSDRKRLFFALRLYPLSFFASTPFKGVKIIWDIKETVLAIWNDRNDMPDSSRYPWNLILIKNVEDNVVFPTLNFNATKVTFKEHWHI